MALSNNSLHNLISSLKRVCSNLETKAELNIKQMEHELKEEIASSKRTIDRFDELVSSISETCSELINTHEILKAAVQNTEKGNCINLPSDIQEDTVKCISELYDTRLIQTSTHEEKLINEKNEQIISDIIKACNKNIHEINEAEDALLDPKELF